MGDDAKTESGCEYSETGYCGACEVCCGKTNTAQSARIEELENAIRSFTSEEDADIAEALFDNLAVVDRVEWEDDMNEHRKKIESLRALVPPHRIG